jgi:hypothetical protein
VKDIVKKYTEFPDRVLKEFPNLTLRDHYRYKKVVWSILNDIEYDAVREKATLKAMGWKDYGTKHYENVYTKFNQGLRYFKFGIDMRTIEKDARMKYDLSQPPYPREEFDRLCKEVGDRLNFPLDQVLRMLPRNWREYRSYGKWIERIKKLRIK